MFKKIEKLKRNSGQSRTKNGNKKTKRTEINSNVRIYVSINVYGCINMFIPLKKQNNKRQVERKKENEIVIET